MAGTKKSNSKKEIDRQESTMRKIGGTINKGRQVFETQIENLKTSGAALVWTVIATFFVMIVICLVVFFSSVQGAEKVMVPDVVGKSLTTALLQMQEKELYAKIQLKYSDDPNDTGLILAQTPDAGAIVKAYRRVTLTVSRGQAIDTIQDYTGKNIDETKNKINILYSGDTPMLSVAPVIYQKDEHVEGTIIAQYPAQGESIIEPVKMYFIVSAGDQTIYTKVPDLEGLSIRQMLNLMDTTNLIFTFSQKEPERRNKNGTVISQDIKSKTDVPEFSFVHVELGIGEQTADAENIQGVYTFTAQDYPFPVEMQLEQIDDEGNHTILTTFRHTGNVVQIPYDVKKGSTLKFYILGKEQDSVIIN